MALSTEVRDITAIIAQDLAEGRSTRKALSGGSIAFGWAAGLPLTVASFVETVQAEGLSVAVTLVTASGTPVAAVAAGAAKPSAVTISTSDVPLVKYAGMADATLEQLVSTAGLLPAVQSVLGAGCLLAFEEDAITAIDTGAGQTATGTDWVGAITAGQAKILGAGGVPALAIVSALDYAAVMADLSSQAGFSHDPQSAIGSFMGSALHVSPKAPTGTAYVLDTAAVLSIEHKDSPVLLVDPFSQSSTNKTRIVGDLFAATVVTNETLVCAVTVVP